MREGYEARLALDFAPWFALCKVTLAFSLLDSSMFEERSSLFSLCQSRFRGSSSRLTSAS
jgi:hypothetical protein